MVRIDHSDADTAGSPGSFERYALPALLPFGVVGGLLFFVINVSRMFLASPGAGAVTVALSVSVAILGGATLLSAAPRMRTSSIALVVLAGALVVLVGGSLTVGAAQGTAEQRTFPDGEPATTLYLDVQGSRFNPRVLNAETGIFSVRLSNGVAAPHTLVIETPGAVTDRAMLAVNEAGEVDSFRVFVAEPGKYVFYCSIPGHRDAGMEGTITVTGDPVSLEHAVADA